MSPAGGRPEGGEALRFTDTLCRCTRRFTPRSRGAVRFYTCGPSVYTRQHLGNYRTFIFEDVLQRYLEHLGYEVRRLIYLTDIEDKALDRARECGVDLEELTQPVIERFEAETRLLRLRLPRPRELPRSSTSVDGAVRVIRKLLRTGHAYRHGRNIYFDTLAYERFGELARVDLSRWPPRRTVRFHRDTYPGHRWNRGDFILWHGGRSGRPETWDTEIGPGRPSWNVQDPAVIVEHLGTTVDISAGGADNLVRHHDYIRAVMESFSGTTYARFWLHGELLTVNGAKMSKRRGNAVYVETLTGMGLAPGQIRFFLIDGHYRRALDLSARSIAAACARHRELRAAVDEAQRRVRAARRHAPGEAPRLVDAFRERMNDDLDVEGAVGAVIARLRELGADRGAPRGGWRAVRAELDAIDRVLEVGL